MEKWGVQRGVSPSVSLSPPAAGGMNPFQTKLYSVLALNRGQGETEEGER
ncbi:hypothetical protein KSB_50870 [Ktedonobacter robiniae]|uniref:Uncharacterized protein n=1 Tax=Ktedonobacter robiniae TaxID=2778365 RepID=A0ABQ3UVJ6_9CHLR|nr:hypothetical protein KSB_50870 [Ktedonobacter robiniae]